MVDIDVKLANVLSSKRYLVFPKNVLYLLPAKNRCGRESKASAVPPFRFT